MACLSHDPEGETVPLIPQSRLSTSVDELVLSEGVESQNLSSLTLASSSVDEYLLFSPRRKIPGSRGVQKNSRLRWTKHFLLLPSPQAVIFRHHLKQFLLLPSPQIVPPSAITPNNRSLLTPSPNIALLMHFPSLNSTSLSTPEPLVSSSEDKLFVLAPKA
jgi:hypothetical protein